MIEPVLTLDALLRSISARKPGATAVVAPGRAALDFAGLVDQVDEVRAALAAAGLGPADRVAVSLPQGPEMAVAVLSVACALPCVPLDPRSGAGELAPYLAEVGARAVIVPRGGEHPARAAAHAAGLRVLTVEVPAGVPAGRFLLTAGASGVGPATPAHNGGASAAPRADAVALVLPTSGTTSRPKRVQLTHANLCASARSIAAALALGSGDRTLIAMPLFHVHGLMMWLATLGSGGSTACPPAFDPARFAAWLEELRPTWYSAVPTIHHAVVALAGLDHARAARAGLRFVRSSSAPLPPRLGAELEALFDAPVLEAYGMTEASHQIASNPLPPGERRPGSVGRPAGAEVTVVDEAGCPLPPGAQGEVAIRGDGVTAGYEGLPAARDPGGWLRTGDLGWLDADGYLHLAGRLKELVNRGGEKIAPREVEEALGAHPAVAEAAVFPAPHPTLGEDVAAAVVLRPGAMVTAQDLRAHVRARLADPKVPGLVHLVERIPTGPTGKIERPRLAELLGLAMPHPRGAAEPPATPIELALAGIWSDVLGVEVGRDDDFFALGGDSLRAAMIAARAAAVLRVPVTAPALFEAPTVAALAARLDTAPPFAGAAEGPLPRPAGGPAPLSPAQQRLWLFETVEPGTAVYNAPAAWRLRGPLDEAALQHALDDVVARHEALRTTFAAPDGNPVQQVTPQGRVALERRDLSHLPERERAAFVRELLAATAARPFDLANHLLLRALLVRLGRQEYVLLLVVHHLAIDGWSQRVLVRDFGACYAARRAAAAPALPRLALQPADLATWEQAQLNSGAMAAARAYWRRQLEGAPPALELAADRSRPPRPSYRGRVAVRSLPAGLLDRLESLARGERATLFMTLLAGFAATAHRYTGADDLVVGVPSAARTRLEAEAMVGFFVNTLPLRIDLAGDPTARELVARVRRTLLEAQAHEQLPFEQILNELRIARQPGLPPLVQVMFGHDTAGDAALDLAELAVDPLSVHAGTAKLDLDLEVVRDAAGASIRAEYARDLFDHATVERLLAHLETVLRAMADAPDTRVARLPMLTAAERRRMLVEWAGPIREWDGPQTIHGLVEAQVRRTPDACAVVHGGRAVTYGELDRQADQLARRLWRLGVRPGARVAVRVGRSPDLIAALLAVLKTGGAFVPLDPLYPAARSRAIVEDARPSVLVTESRWVDSPVMCEHVVCLDREDASESGEGADELPAAVTGAAGAYVSFTSGSTGRPKGVPSLHRGVVNYLRYLADEWDLGSADVVLPLATVAFDASIRELFGPLTVGARIVLLDDVATRDPNALVAALREHRVTKLLAVVPTMLRELTATAAETGLPIESLDTVMTSGEVLDGVDVTRARRALCPRARIVNQYGPTECTMTSTRYLVPEGACPPGIVPIGRPIPNSRVYVVDAHGEPVPPNVVGELLIGGAGVTPGYLDRPLETAASFVAGALPEERDARVYRTGDLVRWRADGNLEILGRRDNQVKIRGTRIEPEEVEAVLRRCPGVDDVAVRAWPGADGQPVLIAYVVAAPGSDLTDAAIRTHARSALLDAMVPTSIERLGALPLTANGKVDRRALPQPAHRPPEPRDHCAPRTACEATVAEIWEDVLGVRPVGVKDDFFALGGHSLLAARVAARLARAFGVELGLSAIFEEPTVAALAGRLTRWQGGAAERAAAVDPASGGAGGPGENGPIVRRATSGPSPMSLGQRRLWFLNRLHPGRATYNEPSALRLEGVLDEGALERALDTIVARHESLRTVFGETNGDTFQIVQSPHPVALGRVDASRLGPAALSGRLTALASRSFDLTADLMLRAYLVRTGPAAHVLLLVAHHIASDGWSMGVLGRELGALYTAFTRGEPSPLPPLSIRYVDVAAWQQARVDGPALAAHIERWRRRLAGAPTVLQLPSDRPRPEVSTHRGGRLARCAPPSLASGLRALGAGEGATLFMALLTGFFALLHRYTAAEDLLVATPVAGRSRVEMEPLIGFFVSTLPLRGDCSGDPPARELLRRVRAMAIEAFDDHEVPFERLVELVTPERSLTRSPLAQVAFVAQDGERGLPAMPGVAVERVAVSTDTAKFDLTVHARETAKGLELTAAYSTDLFDEDRIARLLEHFEVLLGGMVADPGCRLSSLPLMASSERRRVLVDENRSARLQVGPDTIHGLVEAQVARTPDAVAIVAGGETLTYREVNARANRLARHLRSLGVRPEGAVGVCLHRSPLLVVALLAVLKAGGAYVPLDPGQPTERIRLLLADSGARLVLTEAALAERLGHDPERTICVVDDAVPWANQPHGDLAPGAGPDTLAYILYTSGSTGRPKGVLCVHRALVNYLAFAIETFGFGPADIVLPRASYAFDASVRELFGTLASGARMVLLDDRAARDPAALVAEAQAAGATVLTVVPSLLRAMADVAEQSRGPITSLRLLHIGGESLFGTDVRRARAHVAPHAQLVNQYGPTECAINAAYHVVRLGDETRAAVPIGGPVWNATLYVLDPHGAPVPLGLPGELWVGGVCVARGYHGAPELTAARFLPDPFAAEPGARMYRTGDLVCRRADGLLEMLGRTDFQVKIRGNRVEPGEVEARLRECPGVSQAAVVAWPAGAPDARLVAYIVPAEGAEPSAAELRTVLRRALPEYMVPTAFVTLPAPPLGPHGKLDRRALPPPGEAEPATAYVEPRHPLEWQIAAIWRALLKVPQVGVFDDFFELGGHSLLAVQLMQLIEAQVGSRLPLTALFSAPTVAGLAAAVQSEETIGPDLVIPLRASGIEPPFFFFHGDYNGGGFYSRVLARGLSPEQPFYAVHPHPLTDRPVPDTMAAMVTELVAAIRAARPHGPYRLGGHCNGGMFAFEVARRLVAEGDKVDALVVIDASARNVRFRLVSRLVRAVAWLGRLDPSSEAALFLSLRDRATDFAWRIDGWRRRRAAPHAAASQPAGPTPGDPGARAHGGEDLDLVASAPAWRESERVTAFRRVARSHVPGHYAGSITLLVPEQRRIPRRDLWWSLAADRVEVHTVPGAHLTSITEHATEVAERLGACLAGTPRATPVP